MLFSLLPSLSSQIIIIVIIRPMFSAKFASKWRFMTRETISDEVEDSQRFSDTGGTSDFSMQTFIKQRYEAEQIEYSDAYLTKKKAATEAMFASKVDENPEDE